MSRDFLLVGEGDNCAAVISPLVGLLEVCWCIQTLFHCSMFGCPVSNTSDYTNQLSAWYLYWCQIINIKNLLVADEQMTSKVGLVLHRERPLKSSNWGQTQFPLCKSIGYEIEG